MSRRLVAALAVLVSPALPACSRGGEEKGPAPVPVVAGYVASWDPRGDPALERPPAPLRVLSPVWYRPTETGAVTFAGDRAAAAAETVAAGDLEDQGTRLVPSVSNFRDGRWDGDLVGGIIRDPERRSAHIEALVAVARRPGVAGVDLDYESLRAGDRDAYSRFVADLAGALHRADRRLSVTVHAKTAEPGSTGGARAQDWAALGAAADEVRVMAYDHAWRSSPPGPIAPLPWVEEVLRFATEEIPERKIRLGLGTYGYDWPDGQPGRDLAWVDATDIRESRGVAGRWDDDAASPWFTYTDDHGTGHTVWYEDARSLDAKLDLARRYGAGGVVLWKIGGEDPGVWAALAGFAGDNRG